MEFEQLLIQKKINLRSLMEFNSLETIKQCILQNFGITLIPELAVRQEIKRKKLVVLPWPEEEMETCILMIHHKDKWISPVLKKFMDIVRKKVLEFQISY